MSHHYPGFPHLPTSGNSNPRTFPKAYRGSSVYPFRAMRIGEEFTSPSHVSKKSMRQMAYLAGVRYGRSFRVKTLPDGRYIVYRMS